MKAKNLIKTSLGASVLALALGFANPALAATQSWNPGGAGGGSGTWSSASTNWDSGATWTANNTGVFGGAAGTVTVSGTQSVGGLQFNTNGYILAGGGLFVGNGIALDVSTGTTTFSAASQVSLTGNTGVPIAMSKTGTGTLSLLGSIGSTLGGTGANAAAWTISGGTLEISGGNQLGTNPGGAGSVMAILSGGTLRLLGNSVTTRLLQVNANGGTLEATQGIWAGNIANNADSSHTFNVAAATASTSAAVISGAISGTGSVTMIKVGSNSVQLTGANTYIGATTISGGTLSVGTIGDGGVSSGNLGSATSAAGNLVLNNGTLQYTGATASTNRNFTITTGSTGTFDVTANTLTLSGASAATTGALTKAGAGTLVLSGANNHTGVTAISAGVLSLTNALALQNSALDTTNSVVGNATNGLQTTATTLTIGGLAGNKDFSTVFTTTGGYSSVTALTLNPQAGVSNSYSGIIANGAAAMTLTKNGNGTQTLSGANTYTGTTAVTAGTLILNGANSTSGVSVSSGAILGGSGKVAGALSGAGQVGPGSSPGILTATQVNPTGGLGFAFEFTQTGGPIYGSATASGNDVLHLNNATTPFTANLTGSNAVGIYLNLTTVAANDVFQGGFFTDKSVSFLSSINSAAFSYYVKGNGGGSHAYNGFNYYTLAEYNAGFSINLSTVQVGTAAFADGTVSGGYISEISVVPEPSTWALLAFSLTTVMVLRRRRD